MNNARLTLKDATNLKCSIAGDRSCVKYLVDHFRAFDNANKATEGDMMVCVSISSAPIASTHEPGRERREGAPHKKQFQRGREIQCCMQFAGPSTTTTT
ncbi:unnamed protein product [Phytophthora fragariaefolia]|uniref:Unnamed protein product n=1 Tax=Phytophthora fragariaefolia TaxID=1490495 RepID=A0A9W6XMA6_9STRA|nr:unnamed protein product [Phytophthora fragariaefolia]